MPPQDVINNHVCSPSCRVYPQAIYDYNRSQRTECGHTLGDRFVREHVQFGHPNYSWSRVVCGACDADIPNYLLPAQGSTSKQFVVEQEDSSDDEPARKKSIFD